MEVTVTDLPLLMCLAEVDVQAASLFLLRLVPYRCVFQVSQPIRKLMGMQRHQCSLKQHDFSFTGLPNRIFFKKKRDKHFGCYTAACPNNALLNWFLVFHSNTCCQIQLSLWHIFHLESVNSLVRWHVFTNRTSDKSPHFTWGTTATGSKHWVQLKRRACHSRLSSTDKDIFLFWIHLGSTDYYWGEMRYWFLTLGTHICNKIF